MPCEIAGKTYVELTITYPLYELSHIQDVAKVRIGRVLSRKEVKVLEEKLSICLGSGAGFSEFVKRFEWSDLLDNELYNISNGVYK